MRKMINGKYVRVDADGQEVAALTASDVLEAQRDRVFHGEEWNENMKNAQGFFQRAMVKFGVAKPADSKPVEWHDDVKVIPFGAYVVAEFATGGTVKIMRTRGNGLYDVATGDRVDPEMIAKWRRA